MKLWHVPLRLATGAYILEQGISKLEVDEQSAHWFQERGAMVYPGIFADMEPMDFVKVLRKSEIALGAALLLPFVPAGLAGAGLMVFAGSLMRLYMKAPGMRREGSVRPTQQGVGLAKDSWMFGIGLALVLDALRDGKSR
jgi:hypothetical protein